MGKPKTLRRCVREPSGDAVGTGPAPALQGEGLIELITSSSLPLLPFSKQVIGCRKQITEGWKKRVLIKTKKDLCELGSLRSVCVCPNLCLRLYQEESLAYPYGGSS